MSADHEASEATSTVYTGKCSPKEMPYLYLPTILNYVKPVTRSAMWGPTRLLPNPNPNPSPSPILTLTLTLTLTRCPFVGELLHQMRFTAYDQACG